MKWLINVLIRALARVPAVPGPVAIALVALAVLADQVTGGAVSEAVCSASSLNNPQ